MKPRNPASAPIRWPAGVIDPRRVTMESLTAIVTPPTYDQSIECARESLMDHRRQQRIVEGRVTG